MLEQFTFSVNLHINISGNDTESESCPCVSIHNYTLLYVFIFPAALPLGIHGDLAMRGAAVEDKGDEEQDTPIFETHHHLLHGDNKQYVISTSKHLL